MSFDYYLFKAWLWINLYHSYPNKRTIDKNHIELKEELKYQLDRLNVNKGRGMFDTIYLVIELDEDSQEVASDHEFGSDFEKY